MGKWDTAALAVEGQNGGRQQVLSVGEPACINKRKPSRTPYGSALLQVPENLNEKEVIRNV